MWHVNSITVLPASIFRIGYITMLLIDGSELLTTGVRVHSRGVRLFRTHSLIARSQGELFGSPMWKS